MTAPPLAGSFEGPVLLLRFTCPTPPGRTAGDLRPQVIENVKRLHEKLLEYAEEHVAPADGRHANLTITPSRAGWRVT